MSRYLNPMAIIKAFLMGATFLMGIWSFLMLGPLLESRFLPVMKDFTIVSVEAKGDTQSSVTTGFRKVRSCEYIGLAWYRIYPDKSIQRVSLTLYENGTQDSPSHPLGWHRSGPWTVGISAEDLRERSFVEVVHRCHALWLTRTHLFP